MVIVDVPEPGAAIGLGLKLTVTPLGCPEAVKVMAELSPPKTLVVMVGVPLLPCTTDTELGDALMLKPALTAAVTVRDTVVVCVMLPLGPEALPVTVIG